MLTYNTKHYLSIPPHDLSADPHLHKSRNTASETLVYGRSDPATDLRKESPSTRQSHFRIAGIFGAEICSPFSDPLGWLTRFTKMVFG